MAFDDAITLSALKYVCGDSEHVCRLCFASTEDEEISLEDTMRLERSYYDESVTFIDMLENLGVNLEPLLPQVLCMNCATIIINSYLFQKLSYYSNLKWKEALDRLDNSITKFDRICPTVQTAYLMINGDDSIMFTSRKQYTVKNKKITLNKIKNNMKNRKNYVKMKIIRDTEDDIICKECGLKFQSSLLLARHRKLHKGSKYTCQRCGKVFSTTVQLEDHSERVHYPKKIQCPRCAKMFSTERLLRMHERNNHMAAICKLCCIQLPSRVALRAHLDKHEEHKCPRCSKRLLNKQTFKIHLKICGQLKEHKFFCDICNKGYARKNNLRSHLKTDHGFGRVYSCNWCSKKYDAVSKLKYHIVKHTRERNFHCEQCGGRFVTQAALVYHTRLHTGERPFPCDLCSESFLSASRRMEHKRRKHIGPTKECHVCHVKFVTSHQLRKHVQRHYNPHSKLYAPEIGKGQTMTINIEEIPYDSYAVSLTST